MISGLVHPSAVRRSTEAFVAGSRRMRPTVSRYSARLPWRSPRFRLYPVIFPEEASMGAAPISWAKAHSLVSRRGLSPATVGSVAAMSVPMPTPLVATNAGAAVATSCSRCWSSALISALRCW